ncbi:enoyl-CoA hydratase-related protein [Minwuia sp.]|uniref:enoyl-CoA hydratase-related protein n=1 Tax=Minwuia sp. TaxID=2493630 RepID=UPI003A91BDA5
MSESLVLTDIDARGVATVTINRPAVNNAYNSEMIKGLLDAFGTLAGDDRVRLVLIRGNGKHFQAGADLKWILACRDRPVAANVEVSMDTTNAVRGLDAFPRPVISLVHGGCFGGGTGIVAASDIVIASEDAIFSITEARWGLMAGPIIPQLVARMGAKNVRRYALTCERFSAAKALELGLVDEVCATGDLDATVAPMVENLLHCPPDALAQTKARIRQFGNLLIDDDLAHDLANEHAMKRLTDEAGEGLVSFVEKRKPSWYPAA